MRKPLLPVPKHDGGHSRLGASIAKRWMSCPGSVRMARGQPNIESEHSKAGTAAHAVAALALENDKDADFYVGYAHPNGVEITEEMAEYVQVFVDHCRPRKDAGVYGIEEQFDLGPLNPPEEMFGTTDFWSYSASFRTLFVDDLKYGQGVVVEALGNIQLRYYALGAVLRVQAQYPDAIIEKVVMTIVQPRAAHTEGPIRSDEISLAELIEFAADLIDAARKTQEKDAPLKVGEHCRFCPAMAVCPAQRDNAQETAQSDFAVVPYEEARKPVDPETLTVEQLGDLVVKMGMLEEWMKRVRKHAEHLMSEGQQIPGLKLVQRRARRVWADEVSAAMALRNDQNLEEEEMYKRELRSPAQIEKVVGKKVFAKELADLVVKKSSGLTMVPEYDSRPAVSLEAGAEFPAIGAGDDEPQDA